MHKKISKRRKKREEREMKEKRPMELSAACWALDISAMFCKDLESALLASHSPDSTNSDVYKLHSHVMRLFVPILTETNASKNTPPNLANCTFVLTVIQHTR